MYDRIEALSNAELLIGEIKDYCEQIEIVGSIRRKRPKVNDIDIIVIPKKKETDDDTLFGEKIEIDCLEPILAQMCLDNQLTLKENGPKKKRFNGYVNSPIPIDLYICTPKTWATTKLIRTGSKNHNIRLCMEAIKKQMQLKADGSGLMTLDGKIIEINDEKEIFEKLGLEYRKPEDRE